MTFSQVAWEFRACSFYTKDSIEMRITSLVISWNTPIVNGVTNVTEVPTETGIFLYGVKWCLRKTLFGVIGNKVILRET